jgi:hypothetical protein
MRDQQKSAVRVDIERNPNLPTPHRAHFALNVFIILSYHRISGTT